MHAYSERHPLALWAWGVLFALVLYPMILIGFILTPIFRAIESLIAIAVQFVMKIRGVSPGQRRPIEGFDKPWLSLDSQQAAPFHIVCFMKVAPALSLQEARQQLGGKSIWRDYRLKSHLGPSYAGGFHWVTPQQSEKDVAAELEKHLLEEESHSAITEEQMERLLSSIASHESLQFCPSKELLWRVLFLQDRASGCTYVVCVVHHVVADGICIAHHLLHDILDRGHGAHDAPAQSPVSLSIKGPVLQQTTAAEHHAVQQSFLRKILKPQLPRHKHIWETVQAYIALPFIMAFRMYERQPVGWEEGQEKFPSPEGKKLLTYPVQVPLATVSAICKRYTVKNPGQGKPTVNDVLCCALAGAYRRYTTNRGEGKQDRVSSSVLFPASPSTSSTDSGSLTDSPENSATCTPPTSNLSPLSTPPPSPSARPHTPTSGDEGGVSLFVPADTPLPSLLVSPPALQPATRTPPPPTLPKLEIETETELTKVAAVRTPRLRAGARARETSASPQGAASVSLDIPPTPGTGRSMGWETPKQQGAVEATRTHTSAPARPTHAPRLSMAMPFSMRTSAPDEHLGNCFVPALFTLAVPGGDVSPMKRLQAVRHELNAFKNSHTARAWHFGIQISFQGVPHSIATAILAAFSRTAPVAFSNVPGPDRMPTITGGRRVEEACFYTPHMLSQGLSVSAFSFDGSIRVMCQADTACVREPKRLMQCFMAELQELASAE